MNSDFEDDNPPEHTYEEQPFTDVVLSHRFFYGEQTTETAYIAKKSLIPDWSRLIEKPDPVVFYSIHNQQMTAIWQCSQIRSIMRYSGCSSLC